MQRFIPRRALSSIHFHPIVFSKQIFSCFFHLAAGPAPGSVVES